MKVGTLAWGLTLMVVFSSTAFPATITYTASLTGAAEVPSNGSLGTGNATVIVNPLANTMEVIVNFSGLGGTTTASHIHCCTAVPLVGNAGVATTTPTFPGFPLGVMAGSYDQVFDMTLASSYNPAFVTAEGGTVAGAEAALFAGLASGETYLNIHTTTFPGGEIRGYLVVAPEPSTLALLGIGLLSVLIVRFKPLGLRPPRRLRS